ncbi:MAG: LamG-like jellyroll fold domain-containing protein [Elusimicrobiota bacterium]
MKHIFHLASIVFLTQFILIHPIAYAAVADSSLKASYNFDEGLGAVVYDASGNNFNGTISGAAWTAGKVGNSALSFNGTSNYVSIPRMNYDEITVSAWFYRNSADTANADAILGGWRWNSDTQLQEGIELRFPINSNILQFTAVTWNSIETKTQKTASKDVVISTGSWYHAAGTYNKTSGEQKLYINGVLVNTQTHTVGNTIVPLTYSSYPDMRIGYSRVNSGYFNGVIDEIRIYARALTGVEVQGLYVSAGLTVTTNPATNITASSVDLSATVNAKDENAVAYFQYGQVSGYLNSQTASQTVIGNNTNTNIAVSLSSLNSNLTHYYRIAAANSMGTAYGAEQSFTTLSAPDTTPPSLSITIPSTGAAYTSKSDKITISGTASDAGSGIETISWSSDHNSGTAAGTTQWTIKAAQLNQGANTISVTAKDRQGNVSAAKTMTITYTPEAIPSSSPWKPIPLRSQVQKDAGLAGGEGMQMIYSISYAPSNPNVAYFAVDTSQVWKSVDGGNSWISKRNGFRSLGGVSLAVDPKDENTVFVSGSVHRADGTFVSAVVDGIYRTTDGGDTWQLVYQTDYYRDREGQHFVFDPDSFNGSRHQTIYAASHTKGVLKSTDGGMTWTQWPTNTNLDKMRVADLEIHKNGSQTILYVAANNRNNNAIAASANGLYKIIDNNETVSAVPVGNLPDYPRTLALAAQPNPNNDIIYAAVGTYKVYQSTDGGNYFISKNNGLTTNSGYYQSIDISPVDSNYLYVKLDMTGSNIFYSNDGGDNWSKPTSTDEDNLLSSNGAGYWGTPTAPHPADKNAAIVSMQQDALSNTANGGQTWRYSGNGYMGARRAAGKTSAYFDLKNPLRSIFFLVDFGPFLSEDGGGTWRSLSVPRIGGQATFVGAVDPNNSQTIITPVGTWASPVQYTLIRTTNGGSNESDWSTVHPTLNDSIPRFLSFHPQNSNYIYAGFDLYNSEGGIGSSLGLVSQDNGQTWTEFPGKSIRAVYPKNGDIIYAIELPASGYSKLWRSQDKGATWADLGTNPFSSVHEMDIDPQDSNKLYAAASSGIYQFNGTSWKEIGKSGGIPADVVSGSSLFASRSVVVDPTNSSRIYVGMAGFASRHLQSFIYRSSDGGQTWEDIGLNLGPYSMITSLAVDPRNGDLHACTAQGNYVLVNSLPVITSTQSASGTTGTAFSYQITATNSPTSFSAGGLSAGLSVSAGGLISGTPTTIGTSSVTISAANASGAGSASLSLSVYSACDLNRDLSTNVVDVQLQVNQALGAAACTSDLNRDGACNVIDVQRDVNASLGGLCVVGP